MRLIDFLSGLISARIPTGLSLEAYILGNQLLL